MNAKVIKVLVNVGDHVNEGDVLFIVEAMKMEVEVKASASGTVSSIAAEAGAQVTSGEALASIN
jgi:biotin carboxyl carrier protein